MPFTFGNHDQYLKEMCSLSTSSPGFKTLIITIIISKLLPWQPPDEMRTVSLPPYITSSYGPARSSPPAPAVRTGKWFGHAKDVPR